MRIVMLSAMVAALVWPSAVLAQSGQQTGEQTAAPAETDPATRASVAGVQRHVDAYRSGDIDRFVATFTPDAEVYANGMVAKGHAQIRALYRLNFERGAPSIRIHDSGISGGLVFLSVGYVLASGEEICCSYSEYEVTDGKISYLASSG